MLKRLNGKIWGMLALALIFSGATLSAQTAAPAPKPAPAATVKKAPAPAAAAKTATGTITSIDPTKLVISHMIKGKSEDMTFVLNSDTKREGSLAAGSKVSVRYHAENNDQVATTVRAVTATTAKAKTGKTGAKKTS